MQMKITVSYAYSSVMDMDKQFEQSSPNCRAYPFEGIQKCSSVKLWGGQGQGQWTYLRNKEFLIPICSLMRYGSVESPPIISSKL